MAANVAGALRGCDPECVHDLRVATRRARFALRLTAVQGRNRDAAFLRAELAWIAKLLGAVRDWDVFLERLRPRLTLAQASPAARRFVLGAFRRRRTEARVALEPALRSERFAALLAALRAASAGASGAVARPLEDPAAQAVAAYTIAKAARKARRQGPRGATLTAERLHLLRIAGKRLRYTCEFFAELFDGELDGPIRRLAMLQDLLGEHQDAVVSQQRLSELAAMVNLASPAARERLLVLGALQQAERDEAACLRDDFDRRWKKVARTLRQLRALAPSPATTEEESVPAGE
jgi:CHAD domain-containing protein